MPKGSVPNRLKWVRSYLKLSVLKKKAVGKTRAIKRKSCVLVLFVPQLELRGFCTGEICAYVTGHCTYCCFRYDDLTIIAIIFMIHKIADCIMFSVTFINDDYPYLCVCVHAADAR